MPVVPTVKNDRLGAELKSWMTEQRWGMPLYSDCAWFEINGVRYLHTVLSYATRHPPGSSDSEAQMKVASALKADLEALPARGLLVLREGPHVDSDEDWEHDGRFFQSKGRISRAYVRLSFIGGATEDELKALPSYQAEAQAGRALE